MASSCNAFVIAMFSSVFDIISCGNYLIIQGINQHKMYNTSVM